MAGVAVSDGNEFHRVTELTEQNGRSSSFLIAIIRMCPDHDDAQRRRVLGGHSSGGCKKSSEEDKFRCELHDVYRWILVKMIHTQFSTLKSISHFGSWKN